MKTYNSFERLVSFIVAALFISFISFSATVFALENDYLSDSAYSLQYNEVMDENGNWVTQGGHYNPNWDDYNCYAFSIGRVEPDQFYESGNSFRYSPGNICGNGDYTDVDSTQDLAELVKADLIALGYENVEISDSILSVDESDELICLRCEADYVENINYHFMQYDYDTNAWYHKPGNTAVLKYIANNGIPGNNVIWYLETSHSGTEELWNATYETNIRFIKYSKNQLDVQWSTDLTQDITVKAGKDVIYEIVVDESASYNIQLYSQCGDLSFNYEIYSYNKFNGNCITLRSGSATSGSTVTETVNLVAYDDYNDGSANWQYFTNKYYLRVDFGKENDLDQTVDVTISHTHSYNDHYSTYTNYKHKVYCSCCDYILADHVWDLSCSNCELCGAAHSHTYSDHYVWESDTIHKAYCACGLTRFGGHVVESGALNLGNGRARCILCGGFASEGFIAMAVSQLPHTENGSYVTPCGIIVLVDEDIEAYLSGELIFLEPEGKTEIS